MTSLASFLPPPKNSSSKNSNNNTSSSNKSNQLVLQINQKNDLQEKLARPSAKEIENTALKTSEKLNLDNSHIKKSERQKVNSDSVFVNYNTNNTKKIIKIVTAEKDLLEPPKFKITKSKNVNFSVDSTPILHSPVHSSNTTEISSAAFNNIPTSISNYKNPKGYIIPLDKRLATEQYCKDSNEKLKINDKFAKLSEYLYIAEKEGRKEIEELTNLENKMKEKEKELQEQELLELASQARSKANQIYNNEEEDIDEDSFERQKLRLDRRRDRRREFTLQSVSEQNNGSRKRKKTRDELEQVALGNNFNTNNSELVDSGIYYSDKNNNPNDEYNIYSQPLLNANVITASIYRPVNVENNSEHYGSSSRSNSNSKANNYTFKDPHKPFDGTEKNKDRDKERSWGPIQFEKERSNANNDPFSMNAFLSDNQ